MSRWPGGFAAAALVLVAALRLPLVAADDGAEGDVANGTAGKSVEALNAVCEAITECYCTKGTQCGWCETYEKAMLIRRDAPIHAHVCPKWIAKSSKCAYLYCSTKDGSMGELLAWCVECGWFPLLCFVLWVLVYCCREALWRINFPRLQEVEEVSKSVSFATGQAVIRLASPSASVRLASPSASIHMDPGMSASAFSRQVTEEGAVPFAQEQAPQFFKDKRTFEAFAKGLLCRESDRLQCSLDRPYELNLSDLSAGPGENYEKSRVGPHRLAVTLRIALQWRTALGATLVNSIGLMFLSSLFILFLRNAARFLHKDDYEYVSLITKELGAVVGNLRAAVSMLLSFYALQRVGWYFEVLMEGHALQGKAHDIALIAGASAPRETEEDWRARFMLYRLIMLCFFFGYQAFTPKLRFLGYDPLISCGLLGREEAEALKLAHRAPCTVCESWISQWIEAHLKKEGRQQAYNALREYRASIASVADLIEQRAPVSFESLLYVVVYALCAILPFAPSHIDFQNRQAVMQTAHVATAVGVALFCSFYLALLHMLRHLQAPFDDIDHPNDALNPLALMNFTERHLRDYLTAPPPGLGPLAVAAGPFSPEREGKGKSASPDKGKLAPPGPASPGAEKGKTT